MQTTRINGRDLRLLLENGYKNLKLNSDTINNLNVFPVPDGDTGSNMTKTFEGGFAVQDCENASEFMKGFSKNTLMSARGNSGVIFSQFIRGFAIGCEEKQELSISDFALSFSSGVKYAYRSVLNPVEGTMLTVIKDGGKHISSNCESYSSFEECLADLCAEVRRSLASTPELLAVLKEAGVVDSGGAGMLCVFEGMEAYLRGEIIEDNSVSSMEFSASLNASFDADSVFEYGYCTEYILLLLNSKTDVTSFDHTAFVSELEKLGESIVSVCDGEIVKVHIHTFEPNKALELGLRYGEFLNIKIENMSVQHSETEVHSAQKEKYAVVAVASGDGIKSYFSEIGVTAIVDGGQTQNPSADDFIKTFRKLNAEHIIVLPNNSNVFLTAKQAAEIYTDADVLVVPSRSIAEGYSALSMMDLSLETVEEVSESMTSGLEYVTTGYVTVATRDTCLSGVTVHKGDYIGLDDDNLLCACQNKLAAVTGLLENLDDIDDKQVITVFYGADVTHSELVQLKSLLENAYPLIECGYVRGGQEVYSFILAIE